MKLLGFEANVINLLASRLKLYNHSTESKEIPVYESVA